MTKFISKEGEPNQLLDTPERVGDVDYWYISYNPQTGVDNTIAELCSIITGAKNGKEETAIYCKDGIWRILNGDFRKEYENCYEIGGYEECLRFYESQKEEYRSEWSTD